MLNCLNHSLSKRFDSIPTVNFIDFVIKLNNIVIDSQFQLFLTSSSMWYSSSRYIASYGAFCRIFTVAFDRLG